jgi:peroxiredoxin
MRRSVSRAALLLAVFLVHAPAASELEPITAPESATDFSLAGLDGKTHQLSKYRGKVVLVSFWASWCAECIYEMPSLQALSDTLRNDGLVILAVNVGEKESLVRSFAEHNNLTMPILLDSEMDTYKRWPVLGVPTAFLINRRGEVILSVVGAIEWTERKTLSRIRTLTSRGH